MIFFFYYFIKLIEIFGKQHENVLLNVANEIKHGTRQ